MEYDYVARERGELSLQKGGVVTVLEQNQGWWKGDLNGNIGTFPANVCKNVRIVHLFLTREKATLISFFYTNKAR